MGGIDHRPRSRALIRAAVDADLDAIVRVHNRACPLLADTVAALRTRRAAGVALRDDVPWIRLVAEHDGDVVATARAIEASAGLVPEPGTVFVSVEVDPAAQERGVGHVLLEQLRVWAEAFDAERLRCLVDLDDERSLAVVSAWGFVPVEGRDSMGWNYVLDVAHAELAHLASRLLADVEVVPLATRFDDEVFCRAVHDVHDEGRADIPSAEPHPATVYEDWRAGELRRSGDGGVCLVACQRGGDGARASSAAVLGATAAEPVAFMPAAYVDWTVVRRSERRRGIGGMLKAALALWAAERGIDRLDTEVTTENGAMIATNASVGYRPARGLEVFELALRPDG